MAKQEEINFDRTEMAAFAVIAAKNIGLDVDTSYRLANELNRLMDASKINPEFRKILLNQAKEWFAENTPKES